MRCDVAIVGAGPDGLAAAAYLARAGASVTVLERRFERGGSFASDDYSTPFTYNLHRLLLPPQAADAAEELGLAAQGLGWTSPKPVHGDDAVARRYAAISGVAEDSILVGGGTKNLTNALFRVAAAAGARCEVTAEVTAVSATADGYQVTMFDRRHVDARHVIWTPTTRLAEALPFVGHFGVKGAIDPDRLVIEVFGFDTPDEIDAAMAAVAAGSMPARVAGHLTVTTVFDPLQASPGPFGPLHTIRVEALAPQRHPGGDWMRERRTFRQAVYDSIADRLGDVTLLQQFCDTPADLRRRFAARPVDLPDGVHVVAPAAPGSLAGGRAVAHLITEQAGLRG